MRSADKLRFGERYRTVAAYTIVLKQILHFKFAPSSSGNRFRLLNRATGDDR